VVVRQCGLRGADVVIRPPLAGARAFGPRTANAQGRPEARGYRPRPNAFVERQRAVARHRRSRLGL